MTGHLDGTTVLDLGTVGPGARAARILADYGAQLIRIVPPPGIGVTLPFYAYGAMRGVRKVGVDLRSDEGRRLLLDLAARVDVVLEGFRPGVAKRLGVDYDAVRTRNPAIIYCAASGYGQNGPRSTWAGHDINYLAVSGFLHMNGRTSRTDSVSQTPVLPGATVADAAGGGMHAALAVVTALVGRSRDGLGTYLDVSASDGMLGIMAMHLEEALAEGTDPRPGRGVLAGQFACYGVYRCSDDKFIAVGAVEPKFFANLCRLLGREELSVAQYDEARQDELRSALAECFRTRDRDEWVTALGEYDTCVAPVLSIREVCDDQHANERGAFARAHAPGRGEFRQVGPVWAGAGPLHAAVEIAPEDRANIDLLLSEIGYSAARIGELRDSGVIA